MTKPNKNHSDRRIIGQNLLRDMGMPLQQRSQYGGRDVVIDERTGSLIMCTDHRSIQVARTFPCDAKKLWSKPGFQEVCRKVSKGECSALVRIQHSPTFMVTPIPDAKDFRRALVGQHQQ